MVIWVTFGVKIMNDEQKSPSLPLSHYDQLLTSQRLCGGPSAAFVQMLAARHSYKWDKETRSLITADDRIQSKKVKAFEGAAWFKDEFGLLGKNAT